MVCLWCAELCVVQCPLKLLFYFLFFLCLDSSLQFYWLFSRIKIVISEKFNDEPSILQVGELSIPKCQNHLYASELSSVFYCPELPWYCSLNRNKYIHSKVRQSLSCFHKAAMFDGGNLPHIIFHYKCLGKYVSCEDWIQRS